MCYQLIEVYAVCGCTYYQHAVDQCASVNQPNHTVEKKTIFVGASCGRHAGDSLTLGVIPGASSPGSDYSDPFGVDKDPYY
ncbi:hypothetical protein TD95_002046 [Thielaviopsis punctulata]|uniref:Uncharacterized protein n=1 Tax=Thielaviopsis punctulata TaxID=72032 RepID=A0A0F4ZGJ8_9PEZI|nr:hypothetical protein TD95_002046 [Thielaviopsis punctulata]